MESNGGRMKVNIVNFDYCEELWKECPGCGCIGVPTIWGILLIVGISFLLVFLLRFITFTNQTQSKLKGGI
jgi:hypothetical protein